MTETTLSSATREIVIGPDRPFVVIGERINPTGRKLLAAEMAEGDYRRVERDAVDQIEAGAHVLDVNSGVPMADEAKIMAELVELVQSLTDVPLCIDSSSVAALQAGLEAYEGKALVNSVTGEDERLEAVLPLVKRHAAAVIAIIHDESGISQDPDVRVAVARKIIERAADHGIPSADVLIDPVVMPVGAVGGAGQTAITTLRRVREELGANTVCGASNVSFGLPNRIALNATFLAMTLGAGLSAAIVNPLHGEIMSAISAAEVITGQDSNCRRWIRNFRQASATRTQAEVGAGRSQAHGA